MGATKLIALLLATASTCLGAWTVNPSPAIVDITPNIKTEDMSAYLRSYYTLSTGEPHVMIGFNGTYAQFWDVNLSNGVSYVRTMTNDAPSAFGQPYSQTIVTLSNTVLVHSSANFTNQVWEFNPATGTSTKILTNSDQQVASICRAPDGVIFMGSYGRCYVDEWNPSNRTFRALGKADPNLSGSGNYAYYIAASLSHVYTTIRDGANWYLSIMDRATTNVTLYWTNPYGTALTLYDGTDGKVYADVTTNGSHGYWLLTNGTPVSITSGAFAGVTKYDPYYAEPQVNRDFDNWNVEGAANRIPWDLDINATTYSISGSPASTSIGYKQTNSVSWSSLIETNGWLPATAVIDYVHEWTNSSTLLWISRGYGPIGLYSPGALTNVIGPYKRQSTRDFLKVSDSEAYIAGYHLSTLAWNPTQSWTRVPGLTSWTDSAYNPYTITEAGGKYHCFLARTPNNRIWIATHWDRNGVGGELLWINPTNGNSGSERAIFTDAAESPTDLKTAVSGSQIVWTSYSSNVVVFDASTGSKITNFAVSSSPIQKFVEVSSGQLVGVSGTNLFGFTTSGTLSWSNSIPTAPYNVTAFTVHYERLCLGPDGYIWITAAGKLYRIDPGNGNRTEIATPGANSKVMFTSAGDLILYGGSTIKRIASMLIPVADIQPRNSTPLRGLRIR